MWQILGTSSFAIDMLLYIYHLLIQPNFFLPPGAATEQDVHGIILWPLRGQFSQTYHAKWFLSVSALLVGEKFINFARPFACNIRILQVPTYYIPEDSKSYTAWELYIKKPKLIPLPVRTKARLH